MLEELEKIPGSFEWWAGEPGFATVGFVKAFDGAPTVRLVIKKSLGIGNTYSVAADFRASYTIAGVGKLEITVERKHVPEAAGRLARAMFAFCMF